MADMVDVVAEAEGPAVRVSLGSERPGPVTWRILDPSTGIVLFEGEQTAPTDSFCIPMPEEDGDYRIQVTPAAGERFILIDAKSDGGELRVSTPRVTTSSELRWAALWRAIPKAFLYPPRTLWRNRKLIRSMVRRDILSRYRGSFAGGLWTLLNPLLLMAAYAFVFGVVLKTRFGADTSRTGYLLYFLAGMLPWLAFSEAVGRSPFVILEHRTFVKKLVFPLETLPVNLVISGAVTEAFGLVIFVLGLLLARHSAPASLLWLPVLIIPQFLLTAGLCWFLAALGIFLRDLGQIMSFVLTLWFFLTPICYSEAQFSSAQLKILSMNPLYVLVRGYRAIFLEGHAPEPKPLFVLWLASGTLAICGYAWFHRLRKWFADVI